jgi:LuxR family maltose regulon positive regulatory protein
MPATTSPPRDDRPAAPTDAWADFNAAWALANQGAVTAAPALEALRVRFARAGDRRGILLSAAAAIVCGQLEGNYRGIESGLADLAPLRNGTAGLDRVDDELLGLTGLLIAGLLYRPDDPFLDDNVARIVALLERGPDVNLLLAAGRAVLFYVEPRERRELGLRLNALVEARATDPAVTPYRRAQWLWFWRRCARYAKQPHEAERAEAELRELAARHGLREVDFLLAILDVEASLPGAQVARAEAAVTRAQASAEPARLRDALLLEFARTRVARMRGESDSALLHASRARKLALELQCPPPVLAVYIVNEAHARLLVEDCAGARQLMLQAVPLVPAGYAKEIAEMIDGVAAFEAVRDGRPDGDASLASFWKGLRERQFYDSFEGYPEFGAKLCVAALERDIEVDFVRSMIAKCGLVAPADAPASWPWPLRIHALGEFSVYRDGERLAFEGKAQKKPLALLQAVVAHGASSEGRGVDVQTLIGELWPDVDAADPRSSFEVTLSRLRKWIGVEGALRLVDGRLALNARLVWCDTTAFERNYASLQALLAPHADVAALPAVARRVAALYRGKLFGAIAIEPWAVGARERLALKFTRAVIDYGLHLETRQNWVDALRLYEQGLAQDMLSEPIYRALMRCHLALEQRAEARRVFIRCRDVLSAALQVTPASETLALAARIDATPRVSAPR